MILSNLLVFVCCLFFVSGGILILYIFFEISIFPIIVIILGYGFQIEKINSSYYLIFYAAVCSFPFLFVYFKSDFIISYVFYTQLISWELFFFVRLGFIIKFPIYFLHLWLPKAHVEAPTTARILLAGLLLKLGTAGFLRILGTFNILVGSFWIILSFLGIILGSLSCVFQRDSKSLAAYSSITHIGFLLYSLIFLCISRKTGGLILILAHGYTSTIMFYIIGEYYHISSTRIIYFITGFMSSFLVVVILFFIVFLSNRGTPPSLSFISEFIIIRNRVLLYFFSVLLLFFYFVISFYYSLYFVTNIIMGKNYFDIIVWNWGFAVSIVLIIYNIFWISMFF